VSDLVQRVEASIRERHLIKRGQSILVAVSGGVDSMALLEILVRLGSKHRWKLYIAHFNHRLRGRAAEADERFVRQTARRLRLPFISEQADVRRLASEQKTSLEMAARAVRHAFLARAATRHGIKTIALAHHADDQVELFFVRLLRGAGARGLSGMNWSGASPADKRLKLVRPLLDCPKADLNAFAREARVPFREDASNASLDILRNRIRCELLPMLKRNYTPALSKVVLRQMEALRDDAEQIDRIVKDWRRTRSPAFATLARACQRRVLQDELIRLGVTPNFELLERLRGAANRAVTVEGEVVLRHDGFGRVRAVPVQPAAHEDAKRTVRFKGRKGQGTFGGVTWNWEASNGAGLRWPRFTKGCEWFDADKIGSQAVLRHWRTGDRFQPSGMGASVKLQDLFVNQKIPRERRHHLVVAATASGEIWWVEGLRIGERFKLTPRTRRRLKWGWVR
jgi:tRNA(Ile)-lysidine synthase